MFNLKTKELQDAPDTGGSKEWKPIPKGQYKAVFTQFEIEEPKTSRKGAEYRGIKVAAQVIDGEHKGATVFDYVIVEHETSEAARDIGRSFVKKLVIATSFTNDDLNNETAGALLNVPVMVEVTIEKGNSYTNEYGEEKVYPDRNRIRSVGPVDSLDDMLSAAEKPAAAQSAPPSSADSWL